ncbi:MAG: glycosyltransferase [Rubrimonas sp.]
MPVETFLADLDVFVYFHHPAWVEGFGRTIAEAMAAGIPVILPPHFRATFADAAIYAEPHEVRDRIDELWADEDYARLQGMRGRKWIDRNYGPARYLDRVRTLIGSIDEISADDALASAAAENAARTMSFAEQLAHAAALTPVAPATPEAFDIVHLADMRTAQESAMRIAHSVRIESAAGYASALAHSPSKGCRDLPGVHPEIDLAVRAGCGVAVPPEASLTTRVLIVHQPAFALDALTTGEAPVMPRIRAERTVAILDCDMSDADIRSRNALFAALWGTPVWAATTEALKDRLQAIPGIKADAEVWTPSIANASWAPRNGATRDILVAGRIGDNDPSGWPNEAGGLASAYPASDTLCMRVLGWPRLTTLPTGRVPPAWEVFRLGETSLERYIAGLDLVIHQTSGSARKIPIHALAQAVASGRPALVTADVAAVLGKAASLTAGRDIARIAQEMAADRERLKTLSLEKARAARQIFGEHVHRARILRLAGKPSKTPPAPSVNRDARRRMLFVTSNGVGLGHLTRLLAIARRMPGDVEPAFMTMSQGLPIVRQCGYPVEYMPFHVYAGCDPDHWNPWFAEQLGQVIDFHRAETVVFDAGNPYQGLLDAMAVRPDVKMVWVRRGMWRETQNNEIAIRRQRFFDLIVEPTDIAEAVDKGATACHRAFATKVDPIRFLDDHEILSKEDACARIGIDPGRPSCLIQLGSGSNRDIVTMIDTVLEKVGAVPGMQPVIAEWLIAPNSLDLWPGVPRLRGFPLSRYFNAFDFTVSAAGYNSFNEIISFGLPAVFMANDHATMDDQGGRARFAQDNDAAFHLPDDRPDAIGPLVEQLLDPTVRTIMTASCRRIALGNGAQAAANAIAAL